MQNMNFLTQCEFQPISVTPVAATGRLSFALVYNSLIEKSRPSFANMSTGLDSMVLELICKVFVLTGRIYREYL